MIFSWQGFSSGRGTPEPFLSISHALKGPQEHRDHYLKVPRSTSWPLSRMWMPSFRREPKAMYSARAQSTVLFFTSSPRVFRIRLSPAETGCSPAARHPLSGQELSFLWPQLLGVLTHRESGEGS